MPQDDVKRPLADAFPGEVVLEIDGGEHGSVRGEQVLDLFPPSWGPGPEPDPGSDPRAALGRSSSHHSPAYLTYEPEGRPADLPASAEPCPSDRWLVDLGQRLVGAVRDELDARIAVEEEAVRPTVARWLSGAASPASPAPTGPPAVAPDAEWVRGTLLASEHDLDQDSLRARAAEAEQCNEAIRGHLGQLARVLGPAAVQPLAGLAALRRSQAAADERMAEGLRRVATEVAQSLAVLRRGAYQRLYELSGLMRQRFDIASAGRSAQTVAAYRRAVALHQELGRHARRLEEQLALILGPELAPPARPSTNDASNLQTDPFHQTRLSILADRVEGAVRQSYEAPLTHAPATDPFAQLEETYAAASGAVPDGAAVSESLQASQSLAAVRRRLSETRPGEERRASLRVLRSDVDKLLRLANQAAERGLRNLEEHFRTDRALLSDLQADYLAGLRALRQVVREQLGRASGHLVDRGGALVAGQRQEAGDLERQADDMAAATYRILQSRGATVVSLNAEVDRLLAAHRQALRLENEARAIRERHADALLLRRLLQQVYPGTGAGAQVAVDVTGRPVSTP